MANMHENFRIIMRNADVIRVTMVTLRIERGADFCMS